jgi:hypothetical protein
MVNYYQLMACFCDDRRVNVMAELQDKAGNAKAEGNHEYGASRV